MYKLKRGDNSSDLTQNPVSAHNDLPQEPPHNSPLPDIHGLLEETSKVRIFLGSQGDIVERQPLLFQNTHNGKFAVLRHAHTFMQQGLPLSDVKVPSSPRLSRYNHALILEMPKHHPVAVLIRGNFP